MSPDADSNTEPETGTADEFCVHLRAGAAIYNAGEFHAAHDAWEEKWLALAEGPDRDLLNGLIQFTAAVYHATQRNWEGATGLAASGRGYLSGLGSTHRGVSLDPICGYLSGLGADPERIERRPPVPIVIDGETTRVDELQFGAIAVAARVLTEEYGYDEAVIERAIEYGRADLAADRPTSPFIPLLIDIVGGDGIEHDTAKKRLKEHVRRRETERSDVEGLFD